MKLIIDIPESMYEGVMLDRVLDTTVIRILNEIKNGTPLDDVLDKIRAEIEPIRKMYLEMNDIDWLNGCDDVLSIIDKYKAESEDKE